MVPRSISSFGKPSRLTDRFLSCPLFHSICNCSFFCLDSAPLATPSVNFQPCHESSWTIVNPVLHKISLKWMRIFRSLFWVSLLNIERLKRQKATYDWINTNSSYYGKNTWNTRKQIWRQSKTHSFISKYHWKILSKHCLKCKEINVKLYITAGFLYI